MLGNSFESVVYVAMERQSLKLSLSGQEQQFPRVCCWSLVQGAVQASLHSLDRYCGVGAVSIGKKWANPGFKGQMLVLSDRELAVVLLCPFSPDSPAAVTGVREPPVKWWLCSESLVLGFWFKPETKSG